MSGVYLLPFSFVVAISTIISGQINSRLRIVRPVVWVGYAIACLGYGLTIKFVHYGTSIAAQEIALVVTAFGLGLALAVPLLCIQAAMPLKEMAASTTAWLLTRSLGGTLGIAVFQAVLTSGLRSRFPKLQGYGTDFGIPENLQGYRQLANLPHGPERDAALNAFSDALRTLFIIWCPMLGDAFFLSLFTKHYTLNRTAGGDQKPPVAEEPVTVTPEEKIDDDEKGDLEEQDAERRPDLSQAEKGQAGAKVSEGSERTLTNDYVDELDRKKDVSTN